MTANPVLAPGQEHFSQGRDPVEILTCSWGFAPIWRRHRIPSRIWSFRSLRNLPMSVSPSALWDSVTSTVWARAAQCRGVKPAWRSPGINLYLWIWDLNQAPEQFSFASHHNGRADPLPHTPRCSCSFSGPGIKNIQVIPNLRQC